MRNRNQKPAYGGNFVTQVRLGNLDIVLGGTVLRHQVKESVVNVDELVFVTVDVGNIHVVGRGRDILKFFARENLERINKMDGTRLKRTNIDGDKMDLCVSVLASLGGTHVDNLAGTACRSRSADDNRVRARSAPLMTTCPFLRRAEHCMGKVALAPALAWKHCKERRRRR